MGIVYQHPACRSIANIHDENISKTVGRQYIAEGCRIIVAQNVTKDLSLTKMATTGFEFFRCASSGIQDPMLYASSPLGLEIRRMNPLLYRRQFLLARAEIPDLANWQYELIMDCWHLHAHPDLQMTRVTDSNQTLVLLGFLFDPNDPLADNKLILRKLLNASHSFQGVLEQLKRFCGRFAVIHEINGELNLASDAVGLREIYYCTKRDNLVFCGSQPTLLDHFSRPNLGITKDSRIRKFQNDDMPKVGHGNKWIGPETGFQSIMHLLPNHLLNANHLRVERYWPNHPLEQLDLDTVAIRASTFLQGVMQAASARQELAMAITAGMDSRTLLAASKEIADKIHFFINDHHFMAKGSVDVVIGQSLLDLVGFPFHVNHVQSSDKDIPIPFKKAYHSNTPFASHRQLPTIFNVYHKTLSTKLNVCGVGEIGRTRFGHPPPEMSGYYLAYQYGYKTSTYAVEQASLWLKDSLSSSIDNRINPLTLFYWEQDLGNWGAVGNSESDIAIEEFNPFNSHYLFELFLSVDAKYITLHNNILFLKMIESMDPRLLSIPINPPGTIREHATDLTRKLRMYGLYNKVRYLKDFWCYRGIQRSIK